MSIFVGLDCGGSSSRVMAVDAQGGILYQGHSGAANLMSTPESRLRRNLQHAANGCPQPTHACGCFAGLINDSVRVKGLAHLRELFPEAKLRAEPDYTAAYYASPGETDICVIAGTGSLICSRVNDQVVKSGGRGYVLGDEGSSFQFGRDAVVHYLRRPSEASKVLKSAIQEHFGSFDENDIISAVYRAGTPAPILGKFARALGLDAQANETYALESLHGHLEDLSQTVKDHMRTYFPDRRSHLTVSLSGGLWKASPIFRETFSELLKRNLELETINVFRIAKPPLYGAVELAREMLIVN